MTDGIGGPALAIFAFMVLIVIPMAGLFIITLLQNLILRFVFKQAKVSSLEIFLNLIFATFPGIICVATLPRIVRIQWSYFFISLYLIFSLFRLYKKHELTKPQIIIPIISIFTAAWITSWFVNF